MNLISQEFGDGSVELTFADAPDENDATRLLIARIPFEVQPNKSVSWNRFWAMSQLHDQLGELVRAEREIMERGR